MTIPFISDENEPFFVINQQFVSNSKHPIVHKVEHAIFPGLIILTSQLVFASLYFVTRTKRDKKWQRVIQNS